MGSTPVGLSASRGAAVLGLSDYQRPFEVWQRIQEERSPGWNAEHGLVAPDPVDNAAVRWGTAFEDAIVELAQGAQGMRINSREMSFLVDADGLQRDNAEKGFITCHIDGWYVRPDGNAQADDPLHEGKTTTSWAFRELWGEPGTDHIPKHYQIQTQHQMLCTGAEFDLVSVLVFPDSPDNWERAGITVELIPADGFDPAEWVVRGPRPDGEIAFPWTDRVRDWARIFAHQGNFHQYPVAANRDLQKMMVEAYTEFWRMNVLEEKEPDIDRFEDLRRAIPEPVGTFVLTEQEERWAKEYSDIASEIGDGGKAKARQDEVKLMLLKAIRERAGDAVIDKESKEKWVFRNATGQKVGQFSRTAKGGWMFRVN